MPDKAKTVEAYIGSKEGRAQERINELRACLRLADKKATEELKWGKPALVHDGIVFVYAAYKNHVSLHPTPSVISQLSRELDGYTISENTVQFPLDKPIPKELVMKIATLRVYEKNELGIGWK